jgi:opacity protein-like surface antigen
MFLYKQFLRGIYMTNKILRTVVMGSLTLLAFSNAAQADMKPYIEGQIIYSDVKGGSADTKELTNINYSGYVGNFGVKSAFDSDVTGGIELGLKGFMHPNVRIGFSYAKPDYDVESLTLFSSGSITDPSSNEIAAGVGVVLSPAAYQALTGESLGSIYIKKYMFNAYYDFDITETFKPFIGVGLGMADIEDMDDKEFAYSGHIGAKYYLSKDAYLGGKFTYTSINGPKLTSTADSSVVWHYNDIDIYNFSATLGFEF